MNIIINTISQFFSEPFLNLAHSSNGIPILFAFLLGIVGASAPCQFTGNIGAITIYGNQSFQKGIPWSEAFLFTLGKIIAFSIVGLVVWIFGTELRGQLTLVFPIIRKGIGPLFILIGLFMIGLIKIKWNQPILKSFVSNNNYFASFLMGLSFSLAFCPTMFVIFFITLMPVALSNSFGFLFPTIFAIGTTVPLLITLLIIWYLGFSGALMKKGRKMGAIIQKVSGMILLIIGLFDTLTYW
ncbi:sulfite exporter TauE/SafE family protein [Bacillus timonensis]|nr:sulfite exporter TauE/SafE family protein [Bacillus timonensis]